jgi:hypothetical protein
MYSPYSQASICHLNKQRDAQEFVLFNTYKIEQLLDFDVQIRA